MQKILKNKSQFKKVIDINNPRCILLVKGNKSYIDTGIKIFIESMLNDKFIVEDTNNLCNIDFVIAVGGGSIIDTAKIISLQYNCPLLVIPTTYSGAAFTRFAVAYINNNKISIESDDILSKYVFLNSKFYHSLSSYQTACTGMDALAHAIESYWSVQSTEESRKYSEKAIKLLMDNIVDDVNDSTGKTAENMMMGAYYAGKAINIAKTTLAHALSYYISKKMNIPHGHSVAICLPMIILHNYCSSDVIDDRGEKFVSEILFKLAVMLNANTKNLPSDIIKTLIKNINLDIEISDSMYSDAIENVNVERAKNNPVL